MSASGNPITEKEMRLYLLSSVGTEYDPIAVKITSKTKIIRTRSFCNAIKRRIDQLNSVANFRIGTNTIANFAQGPKADKHPRYKN